MWSEQTQTSLDESKETQKIPKHRWKTIKTTKTIWIQKKIERNWGELRNVLNKIEKTVERRGRKKKEEK